MKEKTFKEIINQIKPEETWIGEYHKIEFIHNRLKISDINDAPGVFFTFKETDKYTLQVKKYSFEEALRLMREGKVVKSFLGYNHKIIDNQLCCQYTLGANFKNSYLYSEEILGEWELVA